MNPPPTIAPNEVASQTSSGNMGSLISLIASFADNRFLGNQDSSKYATDIMKIETDESKALRRPKRPVLDIPYAPEEKGGNEKVKEVSVPLEEKKGNEKGDQEGDEEGNEKGDEKVKETTTQTYTWTIPRVSDVFEDFVLTMADSTTNETIQNMFICITLGGLHWHITGLHLQLLGMITHAAGTYIVHIPIPSQIPPSYNSFSIMCNIHKSATNVELRMKFMCVSLQMRQAFFGDLRSSIPMFFYDELRNVNVIDGKIELFHLSKKTYKLTMIVEEGEIQDSAPLCLICTVNTQTQPTQSTQLNEKIMFRKESPTMYSVILNPTVDVFFKCFNTANNFHITQALLGHYDLLQNPTLQDLRENLLIEKQCAFVPISVPWQSLSDTFPKRSRFYIDGCNGIRNASIFMSIFNIFKSSEGCVGVHFAD